jgi:hypothetical protein
MTAFVLYRPLQYVPGFLFGKISHDSDAVLYRPLPYVPGFLCGKISHDSDSSYVPGFLCEKISHDSNAFLYRPLPYVPGFLCEKISHDSNYVLYRVLTGLIRYRIRFLVPVDNCSWMIFHSHELGSRLLTFFSFFLPGISS